MLSENIKKNRERLNISQRELGRRIGKTGQYISYLEGEAKSNPSLNVLTKISEALETPVHELICL
ncbi:helix-turn-helix transcriptional regulator [Clostridium algoriphilum]|uniref:helix-turn-helix domain-containing protein n=1 Tax=Clostridium algoriphilum TaxID=198347 RepID=UPI001CF23001|nr:helix-turn-helix transcriptional regulator [Clostridium algoriphilum]MCB2294505.1 helix-turn-helix transcriptional regulator [Clostridium algoriphilum]